MAGEAAFSYMPKLLLPEPALEIRFIYPLLDKANIAIGRLGRLLITFILCVDRLLNKPLLYLSPYFKTHRQQYYDYLQLIRETGDWEAWIQFFLEGVIETAKKIIDLFTQDRKNIEYLGRAGTSALLVHHYLERYSVTDIGKIAAKCSMTIPTATKSIKHLEVLGIVKEITGKQRHKVYVYQPYLEILSEGIGDF